MANDLLDFDRDRGILTPRDRRFLAGKLDGELTDNEQRQKRYRLRQRMFHALQDLVYMEYMSTRDIGQVADLTKEAMRPPVDEVPSDGQEEMRKRARLATGLKALMGFYREVMTPEVFRRYVELELETRAALDHYEDAGTFGMFEATIDVDQVGEMEIGKLVDWVERQKERGEIDVVNEYPGWVEVLHLADTRVEIVDEMFSP